MLKNIKSAFFIKIIFSYFDDSRLLKLIKFNKYLQHLLNINLYHYKLYSDRYIIFYNNKEGKEYDFSGNILYEGEFLNGKRNGHGKEYYSDQIIFEGEYLDGNKLKGKGYGIDDYNKGKIIYEINNENGKGKEYNNKGWIIFEGEYLNGKRNGYGREYYLSSIIFEGKYSYGKRHGWGREYTTQIKIFQGEYFNGVKWNGKGLDQDGNIMYEIINGKGSKIKEFEVSGGIKYEGEYFNGKRHGKGKEYDSFFNKLIFEGEYSNGKRKGIGKEFHFGNIIFEGEYLYNNRIRGKEYVKGILEFKGEYLHTKWKGKGFDKKGNIIYELNNGCGKVKEYICERLIYDGEYLNGKRHGKGKEYIDGKLGISINDVEYIEGKKIEKNSYSCIII